MTVEKEKTRRDGNSSGSSNSGDIEGRKKNQDSRWNGKDISIRPNQFIVGHFKSYAPAEKRFERDVTFHRGK